MDRRDRNDRYWLALDYLQRMQDARRVATDPEEIKKLDGRVAAAREQLERYEIDGAHE